MTAVAPGFASGLPIHHRPRRSFIVTWRTLSIVAFLQLLAIGYGAVQYVETIRRDLATMRAEMFAKLDGIDRRLSKLDGVPR